MSDSKKKDVDSVLAVLERAARANLEDRCRFGDLIELPDRGDVLIAGDIHGNRSNFEKIIDAAQLDENPERHLILQEVIHDSAVRHPDKCLSFRLLEDVAELKTKYTDRLHILLGNHELAEVIGRPIVGYGRVLNVYFGLGIDDEYGERKDEIRRLYKQFMRTMPLAARTQHGVFVSHSSPENGRLREIDLAFLRRAHADSEYKKDGAIYDMLWGRDYSQEAADAFAERTEANVLIVGHQPCEGSGFLAPNSRHVIIDSMDESGCYILIPLDTPLSQAEIVEGIVSIN